MGRGIWQNREFAFYLWIAFFNAFTDLGHKIIIQNGLFKHYDGTELRLYTAIIQALILLPFVMTFTPAGFLSDKYPKERIIQVCAVIALPITMLITYCYYQGYFWLAFGCTFVLGIQSAIYSPAKYGYIKEMLGKEKLSAGNAAVQAVTVCAILGGSFIYTIFFEMLIDPQAKTLAEMLQSVKYVGWLLIAGTLVEIYLAFHLPRKRELDPSLRFHFTKYIKGKYLAENLKNAWSSEGIRLSIIGLAIFFALNQVMLSTFGAYLKEVSQITDTRIANGIMLLGGIGLILGSFIAGKISKNYIETGLIPIGALGLGICLLVLPLLSNIWWLGILFTIYGIFGGMLSVPLNALIQYFAKDNQMGQVLASNNFVQNIVMLIFLAGSMILAVIGLSNQSIINLMAIITLAGSAYAISKLPLDFLRYLVRGLFSFRYRIQVNGLESIPSSGGVLLLGNHVSWLDWAILQIACPRPIRFVMLRSIYEKWYLRWFLNSFHVIPIAQNGSRNSLELIKTALNDGEVVALFPEGHISHSGHLGTFRTGFEKAVKGTEATIVPFYLHGLWGSSYSYASHKYRNGSISGSKRLITVEFGKSIPTESNASDVKKSVLETSIHAWNQYIQTLSPLPATWIQTAKKCGSQVCLKEGDGTTFSYSKLLTATMVFSRKLNTILKDEQNVGILLPPSAGGVIANLSTLMLGKTIVNLNYTSSLETVGNCLKHGNIRTILTSRLFIKKLNARGIDLAPLQEQAHIVYLEDIKKEISKASLITTMLQAKLLPAFALRFFYTKQVGIHQTAAILFSSGSEGMPKGIELTHLNILSNIKQTCGLLNPQKDDVVLNSLPLFHAFGLTVTTLLPLLEGIPFVCQPDPTDVKTVGSLVSRHQVSILFGTSTFLRMYTRSHKVLPMMFQSLRLVISGAERLDPEVKKEFKIKFGKDIYEGYGATETTPVVSVNLPDILLNPSGEVQIGSKAGTVGLPIPGSLVRIVDPETLAELPVGEAGLILIGGPQIMKGYLNDEEKTQEIIIEKDGIRWYKSGDKGKMDQDGFVTIIDRYSRFAKLGGEMISLTAIETQISQILKEKEADAEIVTVAIPDEVKGEKIILLASGNIDLETIRSEVAASGMNAITKPKGYLKVETIPKLGSGKNDFSAIKKLALASQ